MSDLKLGTQIEHENHLIGKKDAIHVPVVLCELDEDFGPYLPGMRVRFTSHAFSCVRPMVPGEGEDYHGVIDPFLEKLPAPGDSLVAVIIKPGLASSVSHDYKLNVSDVEDKGTWDCRGCSGY
jgi:hypothetical protein